MKLLQKPLQRKLSAVLGAQVTFERLNISLLGGSLDAHGVIVAGDDAESPVLTIKRVRAEISLASALKGEIVVRSLTVERPVLSLIRRADGRTNFPKPMRDHFPADALPEALDEADEPVEEVEEKEEQDRWRLDINKVLLVDGEAHFRIERDGRDGPPVYHASAERIMAELTHREESFDIALLVGSVGRRDENVELGEIKVNGKITDVEDLAKVADGGLSANLDIGEYLKGKVEMETLRSRAAQFEVSGAADLGRLWLFVPPNVPALQRLEQSHARGRVEFSARGRFDAAEGVRVPEFTIRGSDLAVDWPE